MSNAEANAYAFQMYNDINALNAIGKRVSFYEAERFSDIKNIKNKPEYCIPKYKLCVMHFGVLRNIKEYHGKDCEMHVQLDGQKDGDYKRFYLFNIYNFKVEPVTEVSEVSEPVTEVSEPVSGGRKSRKQRRTRKQRKSRKQRKTRK